MGIRPYVDDDLIAGRLVAPFATTVSKGKRWYLVYRQARADEPAFSAFRDWMIEQAGAR
ncbi:transcriptional regulatory protein [alpha proteobacterium BAL199]|jgi:LysR family transcriptional regulator, glycine cleavage system transcriptional activator|nr:transcriptional regulatory protein [alpha proteobacterium BAL199]